MVADQLELFVVGAVGCEIAGTILATPSVSTILTDG
jgi:hypothetical protein